MKRIGIVSDSHGHLDEKCIQYLQECDEIWHAGDIGDLSVLDRLAEITSTRAVYGNIDGAKVRSATKENEVFKVEGVQIVMTHIAGYPGKYNRRALDLIQNHQPKIFICGHSHILKVMNDPKYGHLHINPGAIGLSGFHRVQTLIKISIEGERIYDMEVIEMKR